MPKTPVKISYDSYDIPIVWLTWGLRYNGLTEICSVSLSPNHRDYSRNVIEQMIENGTGKHLNNPFIRTWTEQRQAEHIFGASQNGEMVALAAMTQPRRKKKHAKKQMSELP